MRFSSISKLCAAVIALSAVINAQQVTAVPRLIRFTGSYHAVNNQPQTGLVGATFSIYRDESDGTPLWSEVQNIQFDKEGNYTVLLGSTKADGMPADLFGTAEPRWLQVEIDQVRQPRILLGSVPYALKSADAETLGGLPSSAYLRASAPGSGVPINVPTTNAASRVTLSPQATNGTAGCIGMFSDPTDIVCAAMSQGTYQGNAAISVGASTAYLGALTLVGSAASSDTAGMALYNSAGGGGASVSLDMYNTFANGGIPQAKIKAIDDGAYSDNLTFWTKNPGAAANPVTERMRITSTGNLGIGTTTPSQKFEVSGGVAKFDGGIMFGDGTTQTTAVSTYSGVNNTAIGLSALSADTTGVSNTASGASALSANTTGNFNTADGFQALSGNIGGSGNTAGGYQALNHNTSGAGNTANGYQALFNNTTFSGNSAFGYAALYSNTSGYDNVADGYQALTGNLSGFSNTAAGYQALMSNTGGNDNTAIGFNALISATGSFNVALGYDAGASLATGSTNIMIGSSGSPNDDHVIRIGSAQTQTFIAGISGANVSGVPVLVSNSGQLGIASSSRRFKQDIQDMGDATANLMRLRPVTYHYRQPFQDGSQPLQYGLIAEEVEQVYPELVAHSADGRVETVKYQLLDSMLLNELQKQNATIAAQKEKIQSLEERLARVESLLERPTSQNDFQ